MNWTIQLGTVGVDELLILVQYSAVSAMTTSFKTVRTVSSIQKRSCLCTPGTAVPSTSSAVCRQSLSLCRPRLEARPTARAQSLAEGFWRTLIGDNTTTRRPAPGWYYWRRCNPVSSTPTTYRICRTMMPFGYVCARNRCGVQPWQDALRSGECA